MRSLVRLSFIVILFVAVSSFKSHKVYLATSLRITVIDGLGNYVEGATVTLYSGEEDLRKSQNPVQPAQLTDERGRVTFRDLQPKVYYVDVVKDKMTNYGGAQVTSGLAENKLNKVNIVIE